MYNKLRYRLKGIQPMIMANGRMADPLDPFAKLLHKLAIKKNKVDKDHMDMAHVEWAGCLYHTDGDISFNGVNVIFDESMRVIVPAENIKRLIRDGAAKSREGKLVKAGVIIPSDPLLNYGNGPPNINELMKLHRYSYRKRVGLRGSSVMRTRPIFRQWSLDLDIEHDSTIIDADKIDTALTTAGHVIGLSDWRPDTGRFIVEKL